MMRVPKDDKRFSGLFEYIKFNYAFAPLTRSPILLFDITQYRYTVITNR